MVTETMNTHQKEENSPLPGEAGYTLIEIIIVIVLVGIIASITSVIILQAIKPYTDLNARSDMHYQDRLAVERIAREARNIRCCDASCNAFQTVPANPSATLHFIDMSGKEIRFTVSGVNLNRREGAGSDYTLATGITSATPFRFLDNAGNPTTACPGIRFIEIAITDARGADSLQIRTRVHPRTF
jgi:prepilin-type N-terminal cleavage/methylation domain-containing protein